MGYVANTMSNHLKNNNKNGLETNPVIISILNGKPLERSDFEKEYIKYCDSLGINVYKTKRKYWKFLK